MGADAREGGLVVIPLEGVLSSLITGGASDFGVAPLHGLAIPDIHGVLTAIGIDVGVGVARHSKLVTIVDPGDARQ